MQTTKTFGVSENNSEFHELMSAHEAGHAAVATALGCRVEAVYAIPDGLENGKVRLRYATKFGGRAGAAMQLRDRILITAGAAAAELLLLGATDPRNTGGDRLDLQALGAWDFDYCASVASIVLEKNRGFLAALRDGIRGSMANVKHCKVTRNGTHIILISGKDIEKLFRRFGSRSSAAELNLKQASQGSSGS